MIVLGSHYPSALSGLAKKYGKTFQIALAKPVKPLQHFIVCDSKIIRIENCHPDLNCESGAHEVKAEVNFNDLARGNMLEIFFDSVWSVLNPSAKQQSG
jgi:hypothetical protein